MSRKFLIGVAVAGAALLSGCATGPYYDTYAYDSPYYEQPAPAYRYYGAPGYYYPYPRYYGPPVTLGFGYSYHRYK
jgi:hypothetical protein